MLKFNPLNRNRSANNKIKNPAFAQILSTNNHERENSVSNQVNRGSINEQLRNVLESPKFHPDLLSAKDNPPDIILPPPLLK